MKTMLLTFFAMFVSANTFAVEYADIQVYFHGRAYDNVVLMCDDSYYDGIELSIPGDYTVAGKLKPENFMNLKDCGADWKIVKKQLVQEDGEPVTKVKMKGGSECQLEIYERVDRSRTPRVEPRKFTLDISEAC